jgi:glycosyltransferase involved in cell wall biosynthesis
MKILYCTNHVYEHGGIEKILVQKIDYWIQTYAYEVILCTSEQRNKEFVYAIDSKVRHIDLGINYKRSKSYFHPINLLKSLTHYFRLKRLINECKPDVIVSVNHTPDQYLIPFLSGKTPTVKEFHSSGAALHKPVSILAKLKHQLFMILERYTIKVVLNQDEKQYYPFDAVEAIPNFISPQKSENIQKEKIIISAGRIAPVKQFDHLIAAWSKIAHELPAWAVHIYGEGDEKLRKQLQNQIQKDQVPNIEFKGATEDLDKRMQESSIYAMTSATECFPMVLLEAQAAGMVIISYDCPNGPRNIITDKENGLLVENQNIDAFAKELKQLILNPAQQKEIQVKAQENISKFLDKSIMYQWNELFLKTIKNV